MADSTFQAVAEIIINVFNTEFAAEGFTMIPDEIHEAMGLNRVDVGIAPVEDIVSPTGAVVQETWVEVRFFDLWKKEIDPATQVNPYRITAFAERFRKALREAEALDPGTGQLWFFEIRRISYPRDPTGNKSRFIATIRAWGNNSGLIETQA